MANLFLHRILFTCWYNVTVIEDCKLGMHWSNLDFSVKEMKAALKSVWAWGWKQHRTKQLSAGGSVQNWKMVGVTYSVLAAFCSLSAQS